MPPELQVIDVGPRRGRRRWWIPLLATVILIFVLLRAVSIYVEALWFGSLGYTNVYWYQLELQVLLFLIFAGFTFLLLRVGFWILWRPLRQDGRSLYVTLNNQRIELSPERLVRPIELGLEILLSLGYGLGMSAEWQGFALFLHAGTTDALDPVFKRPLEFYLLKLPIYELIASWLTVLVVVLLIGGLLRSIPALSAPQFSPTVPVAAKRNGFAVISRAIALLLLIIGVRVVLSRYSYLWEDHQNFSGVTYMEAHYLLPGLLAVTIALFIGAGMALLNSLVEQGARLLAAAVLLPVAVYLVAVVVIPGYVTSFIVKPNELGREAPYIQENLTWTRKAFGIENVETRDFDANFDVQSFQLDQNRATLDNIRLWDWHALQDTLRQIQEIRTYYDFRDIDVDRYVVNGQMRQVMVAARELSVSKLPPSSTNWINKRLVYTHGYGVTMNPVNEFTPEGMPRFILSNMPVESSAPEIKLLRPEIYYGQLTDTDVYVRTRQKEFNYPQGEANNYTTFEGNSGIRVGSGLRRMLLAWQLGDASKLPFSDDVTADSRLLMRRNIEARVQSLAPFLTYDKDPYIVVSADGGLYWIIDAFTSSENYPYSAHHDVGDQYVNYFRNSVKVTVNAYDGSTNFYVFDPSDPIISAYRGAFPALFRNASDMPADLRAHVRYPETLIRAQGEAFGLYHTQNPNVFFQREDVWSIARQIGVSSNKQETQEYEPYFVLMQLPGETPKTEFVQIVPFTPASRDNMIGWMAGRCDGPDYGSLLVYNFPKSRVVNGPMQIESRIDQNAQLSSQLTLWNQQGSHVERGNLLVIPIGHGLLYVESIYLKAERSPMPELRLVVLATQEKLAFGPDFRQAMSTLFGQPQSAPAETAPGLSAQSGPPQSGQAQAPGPALQSRQQLINTAAQNLSDYQRLTSEGKLGEAGQRLEELKRNLEQLRAGQESQK